MPIITAEIGTGPEASLAPIGRPNITSWMDDRLDPSKNLKQFTIFNKLLPELRLKIWCHCMPPPGRAVFDHNTTPQVLFDPWRRYSSAFHPDEDVIALPDNFFWGRTPIIFQVCQESRNIGKLRIFPVTGLKLFHGGNREYHPTFQISTQSHPTSFFLKTLWFSPKDTIELPIRSALELPDILAAATQIAGTWAEKANPLKVRNVQFSFLVTNSNRLDSSVVRQLTGICSLVRDLGRSATIFVGMGAGYAHKKGRFYLNDDQERWVYNEDGTFCNPELQRLLECKLGVPPDEWVLAKDYDPSNLPALSAELINLDSIAGDSYDLSPRIKRNFLPENTKCAVVSDWDAHTFCVNSEIIEEHIAKINPRIRYVDEVRASLVKDGFTGGWEKGEACRRGLSFAKTGLYGEICGDNVSSDESASDDVSAGDDISASDDASASNDV